MAERASVERERIIELGTRYADARGAIQNLVTLGLGNPAIRHVAVIDSEAGSERGHHYHPEGEQWIYVVHGRLTAYSLSLVSWQAAQERLDVPRVYDEFTRSLTRLEAGPGTLLHCPPLIVHAYRFHQPTLFLNIDTMPRGGLRDTVAARLWEEVEPVRVNYKDSSPWDSVDTAVDPRRQWR